jgi:uncharacterized protein HemX
MTEETTQTETAESKPSESARTEPARTESARTDQPRPQPTPTNSPATNRSSQPTIVADLERRAQRRGCGVLVLSSILGGVIGVAATLAILFAMNGTLAFNTADLRREMDAAQQAQSNLSTQLETLSGQLTEAQTQLTTLATQEAESGQSIGTARADITALQEDVVQIESNFETVIEASKAVDEFLVAFRAMLEALPTGATVGGDVGSETAVEPTPTPAP